MLARLGAHGAPWFGAEPHKKMLPTIDWQDDVVIMVDQRKLPSQELYVRCRTPQEVAKAIRTMVIRGAPAIGVAAAMGIALGVNRSKAKGTPQLAVELQKICTLMAATRPTICPWRRARKYSTRPWSNQGFFFGFRKSSRSISSGGTKVGWPL